MDAASYNASWLKQMITVDRSCALGCTPAGLDELSSSTFSPAAFASSGLLFMYLRMSMGDSELMNYSTSEEIDASVIDMRDTVACHDNSCASAFTSLYAQ